MLDTISDSQRDRRPGIVICAYDARSAWDPAEDLSGAEWSPSGARTVNMPAADPARLLESLIEQLRRSECRALLLVGQTRGDRFRVQLRAENKGLARAGKISRTGPALARATAPAASMVRALGDAGLSAQASSADEEDAGDFLLYSVLTRLENEPDAPSIGLLRAPVDAAAGSVQKGVKAAATAMACTLSPLPRSR